MEASEKFVKSSARVSGILGFDLGTTNSVVTAHSSHGAPIPLVSDSGEITPSCVQFNDDGSYTIGLKAYNNKKNPNVVYSFKKHMGSATQIPVEVNGKKISVTAKEVSKIFVHELLTQVYRRNPQYRGTNRVVVSVPAYFDVNQVNDTRQVFLELGYTVDSVQQEPTAAALVFQSIKRIKEPILVFDLGGGTFDAVLMRNELGYPEESIAFYNKCGLSLPEAKDILEIVEISGDNHLGGDDIDAHAVKLFKKANPKCKLTERELLPIAELTKITKTKQSVNSNGTMLSFPFELIERATDVIFNRCIGIVDKMLNRAGIKKVHCVLCGGSTKSPLIRERLMARFDCSTEIDPDLAVAVGDGMTAKILSTRDSIAVIGRFAKHLGTIVDDKFAPIIRKGDIIPARNILFCQNKTPFLDTLEIDFYQSESLFGELTKVHTLKLSNITGFDKKGHAPISVEVSVTVDGIVEVSASNNKNVISAVLTSDTFNCSATSENKWYARLRNAIETTGLTELLPKLEEFKETGDMAVAKEINSLIRVWRDKNG